ncbi:MAG TPA: FecR domain-containing protein [Rectinemataceae bacterium]|nr:FecR domain-containing protein [Rectinemataceae bacterium]
MKRILIGLALILLLPALVVAQGKTAAAAGGETLLLSFVPDGSNLTVTTVDKKVLVYPTDIAEGDAIPLGAVVTTGPDTTAELKLKPNGTIIKLAFSTKFSFAGAGPDKTQPGKSANVFALLAGKIRTVAAKGSNYTFSSNTAVCGVRGTDFSFDVGADETTQALLLVQKGLIQFDKVDASGAVLGSIPVAAGEAADTFAATFAAFKFSADQFAKEYGDMVFKKLNDADVPQGESGQAQQGGEQGQAGGQASAAESPFMKWLGEVLGFELGSVTIDNTTYSKVVVQPNLQFGKLKLGLYLPVIYSSDLFDPSDWYHPAGNDEWDFGSGYWGRDNAKGAKDFATDLALKIKYLEYGEQFKDPFFLKVGNLEDLTIGHGLIMRNYANDSEFPAVRRVGVNVGYDAGGGGFEALTNDLADPTIFGARLYVRPVPSFKLALGVSGVIDTAPGADVQGNDVANNLMLLGGAVDLDLPIIQTDPLAVRLFADGGAAAPYIKQDTGSVSSGLKYDIVYNDGTIKNWGAATGAMGNVLFIDWRLEFRYFTGIFTPSLFDTTYDQKRAQYAVQYAAYATDPTLVPDLPTVMGIYGEGGFHILNKKLNLTLGYMWPWSPNGSLQSNLANNNDEFHAKLVVLKGLIPVVDLAGFISYDRRSLAQSIENGTFTFIDANTSLSGELDLPIPKTENLDLAILFSTVPVFNDDGTMHLDSSGLPTMKPSISIETRIHF